MNYIILYNNVTYSLAVLVLLSTLLYGTKFRFSVAFIVIMGAGLLLTSNPSLIMPVVFILLTICFSRNRKEYHRIFYKCLTAITLSFFIISTISSLAILIVPSKLYSDGYNLFVGGALLATAVAVKSKSGLMGWCRELEHYGYAIALELIVLTFFSFVLPRYYPDIAAESTGQWGVFILSFMFVLLTAALLINRIKDLEYSKRELVSQMEQRNLYAEKVNAQYEKVITLKHYYGKLYESFAPFIRDNDIEGLRQYFERYVSPIHIDLMQNIGHLSGIKNELIRNLIEVTVGQVSAMENITLDVDIYGEVKLPDNMNPDIFEILSNFIDNALQELSEQNQGLLRIELRDVDEGASIQIANTVNNFVEVEPLYFNEQKDGRGYGLKRVRAIVYQQPSIKHFTYKNGMFEGKEVLVQQIVITTRGGW